MCRLARLQVLSLKFTFVYFHDILDLLHLSHSETQLLLLSSKSLDTALCLLRQETTTLFYAILTSTV